MLSRNALSFTGLIVREAEVFYSLCPELDVASQGSSAAEARRMLREAVAGYLETCLESNRPYLRPVPRNQDPRTHRPAGLHSIFRIRVDLAIRVHA